MTRVFSEGERGRGFYFEWDGHRIVRESKTWEKPLSSHDIKRQNKQGNKFQLEKEYKNSQTRKSRMYFCIPRTDRRSMSQNRVSEKEGSLR